MIFQSCLFIFVFFLRLACFYLVLLGKHIINDHQKKKCCFCGKKLLKKEVEEHLDKVYKKVPLKSVEYTIGPKGKTDAKTLMEGGNLDENLVDS